MAAPVRQCVICRTRGEKRTLLRIVRTLSGDAAFDPKQTLQGRGAYVCRKTECIRAARESDSPGRALGTRIPESAYLEMAESASLRSDGDPGRLLGFALRSGKTVSGVAAVMAALKKDRIRLVVMDGQTARNTSAQVGRAAEKNGVPLVVLRGPRSLEVISGKVNCKCIGITDPAFAESITKANHG
jgi:uncharacterized protein